MNFIFSAIDPTGIYRDFVLFNTILETGLDILSSLAKKGSTLLIIYVIDESSICQLPTELFDGENFSTPLAALEKEWEVALEQFPL